MRKDRAHPTRDAVDGFVKFGWGSIVVLGLSACGARTDLLSGGAPEPGEPTLTESRWTEQASLSNRNYVCRVGPTGAVACSDIGLIDGVEKAVRVRVGASAACAQTEAGEVWCWGYNGDGELGRGFRTEERTAFPAARVDGLDRIVELEFGTFTACALDETRDLYCWGARLDESDIDDLQPRRMDVGGAVQSFGIGWDFGCAVLDTGALRCWGRDQGTSPIEEQIPIGELSSIAGAPFDAVYVGALHVCAKNRDGRLFCWGSRGHLGISDDAALPIEIPVGAFETVSANYGMTCVLGDDVRCFGDNPYSAFGARRTIPASEPEALPFFQDATAIAVGHVALCATFADGVKCTGYTENMMLDALNALPNE